MLPPSAFLGTDRDIAAKTCARSLRIRLRRLDFPVEAVMLDLSIRTIGSASISPERALGICAPRCSS